MACESALTAEGAVASAGGLDAGDGCKAGESAAAAEPVRSERDKRRRLREALPVLFGRGSGGVGLSALRYSPDGRLLAVGCTNGAIHLFDTARHAELLELRTLSDAASADSGAILSLDWSEDALSGTPRIASLSYWPLIA